ncbi:MAG: 5,10-methylenetetrahydromethanopterin reductase [Candidatus Thorarchaeota archaeon]
MEEMALEIVPDKQADKAVQLALVAEQNGFSNVWITDHYNHHGVWPILSAIALRTSNILLGPGVTNPYTMNPCAISSSIATIQEMSQERAILGLGAGDKSTLESIGITRRRPVTAIREAVEIIRHLLSGERVTKEGSVFSTNNAGLNLELKTIGDGGIDIYVGAQGPQMLKTASMIADGILLNASHPRDVEAARKIITAVLQEGNRDSESLKFVCYSSFCLLNEEEQIPLETRVVVAYIVAGSSERVLERHGIDVGKKKAIKTNLQKGDYASATKAVTGDMIESFAVVGSPDECISRIRELAKVGIDQFVVGSPIGTKKQETIGRIGEEIIPQIT